MPIHAKFEMKNVNMRNFTAPYSYHEYPKWVDLPDGSRIIVNNEEEEFAAIGDGETEMTVDSIERDALLTRAKELGIKTHHRMSNETLQRLISYPKT